uniref:Uncharacterized protein n=1 Tax=Cyclopterus lumpus TaxID=8103 RepID=A0A8C3AGE3_CYCLU
VCTVLFTVLLEQLNHKHNTFYQDNSGFMVAKRRETQTQRHCFCPSPLECRTSIYLPCGTLLYIVVHCGTLF